MKKVFITGGTGFLGFHLAKEMCQKGVEVYALCRKDSKNLNRLDTLKGIKVVYGSLEDLDNLQDLCDERDFDAFYHLAWEGASGVLRRDGELQIKNILWTFKAVEAAVGLNCKKLIVSGTICENQCADITAMKDFHSSSYYLNAKLAAYRMTKSFCKEKDLPLVWCTFYHPVGKFNKKEQLITNTVYKMIHDEPLQFGPAQNWFDVVSAEDLCHGFYLAGEHALKNDRYFIGSGSPRKLYDYLEEIKQLVKPDAVMEYGFYKPDNISMNIDWLDVTPFQNETGYQAKNSFSEIIISLKEWLLEENN